MSVNTKDYSISESKSIKLDSFPTSYNGKLEKEEGLKLLNELTTKMQKLQSLLYADGSKALLVVLQAMDAAGKDSTILPAFHL